MELREVVKNGVDVWAFDYPSFYKGEEKTAFEKKVLDHFWMRQIGSETVGRFLHYFRNTVREIMPYYKQLYESVEMMKNAEIKPLDNYNMVEEFTQTTEESGENTISGTSSSDGVDATQQTGKERSTHVTSNTPQGNINILFNSGTGSDVKTEYASQVEQVANDSEGSQTLTRSDSNTSVQNGESSSEGKTTHKLTRRGNIGVTTYAQLLQGYRETFLNIDMLIIDELDKCFLGVY